MSDQPPVQGYCPSCDGETLFLDSDGRVTCWLIGCENPAAASELLAKGSDGHEFFQAAASSVVPETGGEQ